jgi:glyoxylase-like metal-dependent hydrolase (beta-lactamase superfamily II)
MERSSTALAAGGRVWLVDPVRAEGLDAEIDRLGRVAAVVQTIPWHDRDVAWFAHLYGVPVLVPRGQETLSERMIQTPVQAVDAGGAIPDSPLRFIPVGGRGWGEAVVWWPERRVLVTGDVLGNASYFVRDGERLAVHPLRRLWPPAHLVPLRPERIHPGHGVSVTEGAAAALAEAVATSRSQMLQAWLHGAVCALRRVRRAGPISSRR